MITRRNRWLLFVIAVVLTLLVLDFYKRGAVGWAVVAGGWGLALAGYVFSLILHPHVNCRACNGTGGHQGGVYGWGHRRCQVCGGQGRHRRWGTMVISREAPVRAEDRAREALRRPNRPR